MDVNNKIGVYIKIDEDNDVTDINSNIFISDTENWIKIDEGEGERYAHAQNNYLGKSIVTENGIYRYKYINNAIAEKTVDEIEQEIAKIEIDTEISDTEIIQAEMLLNQESIIAKQKEHDEILAELLLGQQKGA